MDLQFFIALNLMSISGLVMLFGLVNRAKGGWSWMAVNAAVLAVGLLALRFAWDWSGFFVASVFVPLVLAPFAMSYLAQRRSMAGRVREAARYFKLAALLHPTAHTRFGAALAQATAHEDTERTIAALAELGLRGTPVQKAVVAAMQARELGRWDDILHILRQTPQAAPLMRAFEIRALGECGHIEESIGLYESTKSSMPGADLTFGQLFVLAFGGRTSAVDLMCGHQLAFLDAQTKDYWKAVAELNSPIDAASGRERMQELARTATNTKLRRAAERHLESHPPGPRPPHSEHATRILDETEARINRAAQFGNIKLSRLPATVALLAMNVAAFALEEYRGGSEDLGVLVDLGALWPPLVWQGGEWWRLASASFLHYGPVHLCANLFMLLLLGRVVETAFGWSKFLFIYIVGGLGSMACVMALMLSGTIQNGVLIGASGAIFAVFGAEAARQISCWKHSRDALDKRQLVNLALIILVQVVIDFSVPQISAAAHMSGFLIGLILGWLLNPSSNTASQRTASARQLP